MFPDVGGDDDDDDRAVLRSTTEVEKEAVDPGWCEACLTAERHPLLQLCLLDLSRFPGLNSRKSII